MVVLQSPGVGQVLGLGQVGELLAIGQFVPKAAGATEFYSHDARCRKLAEALNMKSHDLPKRHPNMFVDSEIRKHEGQ